ncbi:MAG TPA: TonB-dependent receptor, partial [bacterium]|nr:TonB-dependent receptor [bacterium]
TTVIRHPVTPRAACAILLLALAPPAAAQTGKITGVVTDQQTGQALAGVQVFLEGTGRGSLTDQNGRYFILNVPPGTYTVVAQLIGYATVRRENVLVSIDVTRTVDFALPSQAVAVQGVVVQAERVPLVEVTATGASDKLSLDDITSIPVTDINQALALRSGFLEVPQNTDVVAFTEEARGISPVRIRGGRQGETLTLIDGVPINNFVFGGPAFQPTPFGVRQLDFIRGGFEPQYGNALSGIINIATREGGTQLEGSLDYRTTRIAGALGSRPDELENKHIFQGFIYGPVPGTGNRLRFAFAGREERGASRVLEFDDEAFDPKYFTPQFGFSQPHTNDLWRGWRSFGFDDQRDLFGKLTFYANPAAKLSFTAIDYQRQTEPFLFDYLLAEGNPVDLCTALYRNRELCQRAYGGSRIGDLVKGSIRQDRRLFSLRWDHTLGRTFYWAVLSRFDQSRETCNWYQGVCLEARFANRNFTENFQAPGITVDFPAAGTAPIFGGEDLETTMARFDIQSQLTDHHNIQAGIFYQGHDLRYLEQRDRGISDVLVVPQRYRAEPWDAAVYFQDRIEYDFITVNLGFRFDFGEAKGLFFANPLDPTNGTTAFDVCDAPGRWQNVRIRRFDASAGHAVEEVLSANPAWTRQLCAENRDTLSRAALIATSDDFTRARRRSQFSPRISVSIPVTEGGRIFANFGRYSQNPLYNNLYQGTGIGTEAEGTPQGPQLFSPNFNVPFVGNPNLVIEETTAYEIGYLAELLDNYGLQIILFSKDQNGLTGVRTGGVDARGQRIFDEGVTYGTNTPSYPVLVNQDFTTVVGIEVGIRRRLTNYWGFDLNYAFSRATTNAAPPERQFERFQEGDPESFRELPSEIDQPHVFNGTVRFRVGEDSPLGGPLGHAIRNATLSFVVRAASGLPYTPTAPGAQALGFNPDRREINSGRAPATLRIDVLGQKEWRVRNLRYTAFAQVTNLTDRLNCIQVSPATGRCDAGAFDFLRRRVGNPVGEGTSSTQLDRPQWIGERRSILAGLRVSF